MSNEALDDNNTVSCDICGRTIGLDELHTNREDEVVCASCCGCGRDNCPNWETL